LLDLDVSTANSVMGQAHDDPIGYFFQYTKLSTCNAQSR
jgi:hypothetical protein